MQRTGHTGWLWTVTVVGAILMLVAGVSKLLGAGPVVDMLLGLNVPAWAIPVIGTMEVAGSLLFGALVTHILNAHWSGMVLAPRHLHGAGDVLARAAVGR